MYVTLYVPLASLAFTVHVFITKEIVAIVTSNFVARLHVTQYKDTGCISTSWYELEKEREREYYVSMNCVSHIHTHLLYKLVYNLHVGKIRERER